MRRDYLRIYFYIMKEVIINTPNQNKERKRIDKSNNFSSFTLDSSFKDLGKNKKYYLYTYGCQGNESDSEKIRGILEELSFTKKLKMFSFLYLKWLLMPYLYIKYKVGD